MIIMKRRLINPRKHDQRGIVLVMATMFLIALTIIVISLMRTTIQEERMVANSRDWNNAFQAAEAALRDGEQEVLKQDPSRFAGETNFKSGCDAGRCTQNVCASATDCKPIWIMLASTDTPWKDGSSPSADTKSAVYGKHTDATSLPGIEAQPRYIIEPLRVPVKGGSLKTGTDGSTAVLYRVTAVGFGVNTSSRVMLQGVFKP